MLFSADTKKTTINIDATTHPSTTSILALDFSRSKSIYPP
ncbi:hypothetical protein PALA9_02542 [Pseudomonas aeruginosa]|nr:hypothetical protein PALA9_02542 [Pseudomonas aeruginosa]